MLIVETYKDLCEEIEGLEWLLNDLYRQFMRNENDMNGHKIPFLKTLSVYDNLNERIAALEEAIKEKKELARKVEQKLSQFTGIRYTIAYLQGIRGLSLKEIAAETGYDYAYIRQINSKIKKEENQKSQITNNAVAK